VPRTVLICDDAIFMRTMVGDILTQAGFRVVGEAATGVQAVERYKALRPDLVTMDIVMPDLGGIDAVREITQYDPEARVLMCSAMGSRRSSSRPSRPGRATSSSSRSSRAACWKRWSACWREPPPRATHARGPPPMNTRYAALFAAEAREQLAAGHGRRARPRVGVGRRAAVARRRRGRGRRAHGSGRRLPGRAHGQGDERHDGLRRRGARRARRGVAARARAIG
jgi:two-component system chemotaxis response regulator CheY